MKFVLFLFILLPSISFAWFDSYKAIKNYNLNQFDKAAEFYKKKLLNDPNNIEINYNLGDVFYKREKYDEAEFYFNRALDLNNSNKKLMEYSHFNLANTLVKLNKLEDAVKEYEKVLSLNSENERARHNLEIVKKMIKKKQEEEKNNQKNKEQKKSEQQKNSKGKDQKKEDSKQKSDVKDNFDNNKTEKKGEEQGEKEKQDKADQNSEKNRRDESKQVSNENNNSDKQEEIKKHNQPQASSDKQQKQNIKEEEKNQFLNSKIQAIDKKLEESGLSKDQIDLLERIEYEDMNFNKQLIKFNVNKNMTGKDGENKW